MAKNQNKPECASPIPKQDFENYIKEVEGVTADMHRFVHKMRKMKSSLLKTELKPDLGKL
jgi:hypothetical protein